MTDRELLELAAKAAGIDITFENGRPKRIEMFRGHLANYEDWNPLTDDGDALRLAVKLRFTISTLVAAGADMMSGSGVHTTQEHLDEPPEFWTSHDTDPYAATRQAIVRAAAEIGKETN